MIVPAGDAQNLEGATLDFEAGGLVLRNPNRPKPVQLGALIIDDEVAGQIRSIIDDEINPALDSHGGFVTLVGHDGEGRAYLTMGGGCHGCAMSRMTMLQGVQATIKERVPVDREGHRRHRSQHRREPLLQLRRLATLLRRALHRGCGGRHHVVFPRSPDDLHGQW